MLKEMISPYTHPDGSVMPPSLPDFGTALFVANYLHQLRVTRGMDLTLDQAIQICSGHPGRYRLSFMWIP